MEHWQINRAGVINFWYYDDEEFQFESGRLLLRGANGSGKSVTMQSLVPLLFDGNKSPERLDPFGSRARKMDSYLLSEGLDLEERTGYLFLEFTKPQAQRYLTIGMGMRARKNMAMQTWYFIIWDNRRLGANHDLSLYKDVGEKLPLTQKELENKIGDGGQLFTRQRDYKKAVNDYLFGYADLSDFDELIELLIQIRSPKLSKEFKPTTMYEIMQNSLVTLTEEDLRPMSEAIENMDEIQETIEGLKNAMHAIGRIDSVYSKYNQFMLVSKANRYLDSIKEEKRLEKAGRLMDSRGAAFEQEALKVNENLELLEEEIRQLRLKEARLSGHDLTRLASEKIELEGMIEDLVQQVSSKEAQVDAFIESQNDIESQIKVNRQNVDLTASEGLECLSEMKVHAEDCSFDEHEFLVDELEKQAKPPYDFTYHNSRSQKYRDQLKTGHRLIQKKEHYQQEYESVLEKREVLSQKLDHQRQCVLEHERQFAQIKEEFAEKAFTWLSGQDLLKIERKVLQLVVERVYRYGDPYRFDQVLEPVREAYEAERQNTRSRISAIEGRKSNRVIELEEKKAQWERIHAQKEPEPERSEAVLRNRDRLRNAGIPFVPLYKALDFEKNVDDILKGRLEEALDDMGILDALVVRPSDREKALEMDQGMADKYLFANPQLLSHTLAQYLHPDTEGTALTYDAIDDVVQSILLNADQGGIYVNEKGAYGMGIISGRGSGKTVSRFIGYHSRKRYKAELLEAVDKEIQIIKEDIKTLDTDIADLENLLDQYQNIWADFPEQTDLDSAMTDLHEQRSELRSLQRREEDVSAECDVAYERLKSVQVEMIEATRAIALAVRSEVYEEAIEALDDYLRALQRLMRIDQKAAHLEVLHQSLTDQESRNEGLLVDVRHELNRLESRKVSAKQRLDHIVQELELKDYKAVLEELETCKARLDELPGLQKNLLEKQADISSELKRLKEDRGKTEDAHQSAVKRLDLYTWAFEKEWNLSYVFVDTTENMDDERDSIGLDARADQLVNAYGTLLEEGKTVMDYTSSVNGKYLAEGGELAEYHLKGIMLFKDIPFSDLSEDDRIHIERLDIQARMQGRTVRFYEMKTLVQRQIIDNDSLLEARDRQLFEETLINTISRKISSKIYHSEKWVNKIDALMTSMNTSSGLNFNLKWKTRKAESEDQLSTEELVGILKGEPSLMTREKKDRLISHFRSKINQTRSRMNADHDDRSFLTVMKEILDYRKWFEFQLYYTKTGDRKKELTNNAFFTFSGGEKAMAMYVPLFSAVYAKYQGGEADCPKVISLDEAFAGVDEKNIADMFRLLVELDLSFIANSQVLFGDYETIPALGIYELIRPENVTYVTLIHYLWNGNERRLVADFDGLN